MPFGSEFSRPFISLTAISLVLQGKGMNLMSRLVLFMEKKWFYSRQGGWLAQGIESISGKTGEMGERFN